MPHMPHMAQHPPAWWHACPSNHTTPHDAASSALHQLTAPAPLHSAELLLRRPWLPGSSDIEQLGKIFQVGVEVGGLGLGLLCASGDAGPKAVAQP
jgi:hypothetical protein